MRLIRYCIITIIILLIIFISNYYSNNYIIESTYKTNNIKTISMLFETDHNTGIYEVQSTINWPTIGYRFNKDISKCKFGSTIEWDNTNNRAIVKSDTKDYCYLFFDYYYCEQHSTDPICSIIPNYDPINNIVYHHDSNLTNGANDGSFRYAGENPKNYVCFGSDIYPCPDDNLYRILGKIPVDVVIVSTTTPVTTQNQMLFKLIRNDFETESTLGMTRAGDASTIGEEREKNGNEASGIIDSFYWSGAVGSQNNNWASSSLNTTGLNVNVYGSFTSAWQDKIANVMWKVGGNLRDNIICLAPMSSVYSYEISNSGIKPNGYSGNWSNPLDNQISNKIGLMYMSDYGFATLNNYWVYPGQDVNNSAESYYNNDIRINNWMNRGVHEWSITRTADNSTGVTFVQCSGSFSATSANRELMGLRRVFYLTQSTTIDMVNHEGTITDPFRIS